MWNFPTTPSVVEVWSLNHWATGEAVLNIFFRFYCFKKIFLFFLAVLGLCCSTGFPLVVENGGSSLVVVCRLLIAVASLVEHRLQDTRASVAAARGSRAQAQ